ncbi:hypothetical protein D3093_03325 [Azospirillum argentinense]|uniref:Uncharacterized protein n=1 Tax=Azospirillum argentinense TaxID=2970906 RepID=A0A4D8P673_9PROT|nr:hypothetical protein [Azospirillum argentinense]QCN94372.1 hypothetical protein D3093_03325 [Azospirillum argentinense]
MPFAAAPEFKKHKAKCESEAKKIPNSGDALAVVKKSGDVEKAAAAWDKAYKAGDAKALRAALADLLQATKIFRAKLSAVIVKAQKAKNEGAVEVAADMLGGAMNVEQMAQLESQSALKKLEKSGGKEMPATTFFADWTSAKKMFEALTGKKKPAEGFLLTFRASSGLEKATKALDAATRANDVDALQKAIKGFEKTGSEYFAIVKKKAKVSVAADDTDIPDESEEAFNYDQALAILLKNLNVIRREAGDILAEARK